MRLFERAKRLRDHTPALKIYAEWVRKATDDAFQNSRELDGTPFPALADSTIEDRVRTTGGKRKSKKKEAAMRAPGGIKPLIKTGRMRNSQRAEVTGTNALRWSAIGYTGPHVTGSLSKPGRPPRRNPTVFEGNIRDGSARLQERAMAKLRDMVASYVETGKVSSSS